MNKKSVVVLCVLLFVFFTASSCSSGTLNIFGPTPTATLPPTPVPTQTPVIVPGITTPIIVDEMGFLFYEAETMEESGFDPFLVKPKKPFDMLIMIRAHASGVDLASFFDIQVALEYLKDGKSIRVEFEESSLGLQLDNARFLFSTYKEGVTDYKLVFPDGQRVPLDTLIDK